MNSARIAGLVLPLLLGAASVSSQPIGNFFSANASGPWMPALATSIAMMPAVARQAKKSSASQVNLYKEVMERKDKLRWRDAPSNGIPSDVCMILNVCGGGTPKMVTLPRASEKGQDLGRGLLLTKTNSSPSTEAVVLEHQTVMEVYFFLVAPNGTLSKVAYISRGASWTPMSPSLAKPIFERDKKDWMAALNKVG